METAFRFGGLQDASTCVLQEVRAERNGPRAETERIALLAHGALVTLHLLGVAYHTIKPRRDLRYAAVHGAAAAFDLAAAIRHGRGIGKG